MLYHLAVKIGDIAGAAKMVRMVEELQVLVVVRVFERLGNCVCLCLPCLSNRRLHRAVVAAESLSVSIVVIVSTVVRHFKGLVVVLDDLLLCRILSLIVDRKTIGICTCILYAARVRTVGGEITYLRHDALTACVDMLGISTALVGNKIWADIERELSCVCRATGEYSVDIHLVAFAGSLDCALAVGIIPVVGHEAVVVHCKQTIFLVPDELTLTRVDFIMSIFHHASGVHIYKVSVPIIQIYVIVLDVIVSRSLFRAIINVFNICELELLSVFCAVGI